MARGTSPSDQGDAPLPDGGDVMAPPAGDEGDGTAASDALRWAVLAESEDLSEPEVLRLAAQHAAAASGAAVALVHLRGAEPGTLRLAAVAGLPSRMARSWELLEAAPRTAYGIALEQCRAAWSTALPDAVVADPQWARWAETGILSVPIEVHHEPIGVLSLLTREHPGAEREAFLLRLAALAGRLLRNARRWQSGAEPWWQEPLTERRAITKQVAVGTWSWDLSTGLLEIDGATHDLLIAAGLDPGTWDHRIETWMTRIHPDDRPGVQEAIDQSMRTGELYAVEYRVLSGADHISWLELRGTFEYDESGAPVKMFGTAWDVTARRNKLDWLVGVLELHPDPVHVIDAHDRVQWANRTAREMAADGPVELVGAHLWDAVEALRGQGLEELFAQARATPGAAMTLEVQAGPRPGGGARSTFHVVRAVQISGLVAVQMSDITDARRAEREAAGRIRKVMELNAALVRALDTDDVVDVVSSHLLPMFEAQGFLLHDLTGPRPRLIAEGGYPDDVVAQLHGESGELPARHELIATNAARFVPSASETDPRTTEEVRQLGRYTGKQAWAALPLRTAGRLVGSCVVAWSRPRQFTSADEEMLVNLAALIAQALDNARLYVRARHQAQRLQQELLPGDLPDTFAVRTAARYRTAPGHEFGGDWYDVVPLSGGRVLAVIGDVMGHGLEQAITMGIIRHAVLAIAALDMPVDELMARLNDVVSRLSTHDDGQPVYATSLFVIYDATTGSCRIASAGHPPPIVLRPDSAPVSLDIPAGPPLGLAQVPAEVVETTLEPDSALILYTNGLLGANAPDTTALEARIARYRDAVGPPTAGSDRSAWLEALCDVLAAGQRQNVPPDDAALLVLGTEFFAPDRIASWDLTWSPESAGQARELTAKRLAAWDLGELAEAATLVVSELVGNTVRHAVALGSDSADRGSGVIRLRLLNLSDPTTANVVCEVYDGSEATPRVRHPSFDDEFGRGLQLVAMMADQWGARFTEAGKCIWATLKSTPDKPIE